MYEKEERAVSEGERRRGRQGKGGQKEQSLSAIIRHLRRTGQAVEALGNVSRLILKIECSVGSVVLDRRR